MKHLQTFESFINEDQVKIGNLTINRSKNGVQITRTDYNGGVIAEQITIFKNEIAALIEFLQKSK